MRNIIDRINNGVETANGKKREYEYLDFILETGKNIEYLIDKLEVNEILGYDAIHTRQYRDFVRKALNRNKAKIDLNMSIKLMKDNEVIEVGPTDKEKVITFMKERKIPLEMGFYMKFIRMLVNQELNFKSRDNNDRR